MGLLRTKIRILTIKSLIHIRTFCVKYYFQLNTFLSDVLDFIFYLLNKRMKLKLVNQLFIVTMSLKIRNHFL